MAITPLYDKVVIRPLISDQTTSGGIVIPGTADNSDRGVVVAVGVEVMIFRTRKNWVSST